MPVVCALRDLISARGQCSNSRGRDNARAEGEIMHETKASALSAQDRNPPIQNIEPSESFNMQLKNLVFVMCTLSAFWAESFARCGSPSLLM